MDCEAIIAVIGICASSVFAGVGLLFNYFALKQNNEIAISAKLSEASNLLSDELLLQVRLLKRYESEARETESRLSDLPEQANPKLEALNKLIATSLNRQKEIDKEAEEIFEMFLNFNKLDMGKTGRIISKSYRLKTTALHLLEYVNENNNGI